jgi:hypothetical protein
MEVEKLRYACAGKSWQQGLALDQFRSPSEERESWKRETDIDQVVGLRADKELVSRRCSYALVLCARVTSSVSIPGQRAKKRERVRELTIFHLSMPPYGSTVRLALILCLLPSWPSFSWAAKRASCSSRVSAGGGTGVSSRCAGCHGDGATRARGAVGARTGTAAMLPRFECTRASRVSAVKGWLQLRDRLVSLTDDFDASAFLRICELSKLPRLRLDEPCSIAPRPEWLPLDALLHPHLGLGPTRMSTSLSQTSSVSPAPLLRTVSLLRAINRQAGGRREEERGGKEQAGSHHDALKLLRAVAASPSSSHTLKQETSPSMRSTVLIPPPPNPRGNRLHARRPRRGSPHLHDHAPEILHRRLLRIRLTRRSRRNGSAGSRTDEQVWRHPRHGHGPVSPPRVARVSPLRATPSD